MNQIIRSKNNNIATFMDGLWCWLETSSFQKMISLVKAIHIYNKIW